MKPLPTAIFNGWAYVQVSLYTLQVPSAFGGRARFDVNRSHLFTQGVLAAINLVGGRVGDGGGRAIARCEAGLPLCSVAITALLGQGHLPSCWSRNPRFSNQIL